MKILYLKQFVQNEAHRMGRCQKTIRRWIWAGRYARSIRLKPYNRRVIQVQVFGDLPPVPRIRHVVMPAEAPNGLVTLIGSNEYIHSLPAL